MKPKAKLIETESETKVDLVPGPWVAILEVHMSRRNQFEC